MFAHQFLFCCFFLCFIVCVGLPPYSMHHMFASSPDSLSQIAPARYCYILSKCTKKIRRGKTITLFFNETYSLPHRKKYISAQKRRGS